MSYVFTFDASACSGCKACQAACKDKNELPAGVFWRRVFEVNGGDWTQVGDSWLTSVFAYNFSMACNHCVHPKCAGVCPTNAYRVREDGIVLLDSARCAGCGYCNWACPYSVPQYNPLAGHMSKCNFCIDRIDAGESPACVAACPMRVLDFKKSEEAHLSGDLKPLWLSPGSEHPFPLPTFSRTQPHLLVKFHPAMLSGLEKSVVNHEETRPQKNKSEFPLLIFTLLSQTAVGAFWASGWVFAALQTITQSEVFFLQSALIILVGACLGLGMLVALAHLGSKRNAIRMLNNLKKSWLSKEVLFVGLFGSALFLYLMIRVPILNWLASVLGFGLIYSMANVYHLRSMPSWNNWRTLASFLLSAVLLGQFILVPILLHEVSLTGAILSNVYMWWFGSFSAVMLAGELALTTREINANSANILKVRIGLILSAMICAMLNPLAPAVAQIWLYILLFLILCVEESIGRWFFYCELEWRIL